ncbi:hypothetical protein GCM10028818_60400 [Spirosoma horti]
MTHLRRKLVPLLLLTALAIFCVHEYYHAREVLAKWAFTHQTYFASDKLVRIVIPKAELSHTTDFLVTENEFEWMGQMVDVLYREVRSDTVYVYGFRDEEETELKRQAPWLYEATAHVGQTPGTRSGSRQKHVKWRPVFVLPDLTAFCQRPAPAVRDLRPIFQYCSRRAARPYLDVLSPPPNV